MKLHRLFILVPLLMVAPSMPHSLVAGARGDQRRVVVGGFCVDVPKSYAVVRVPGFPDLQSGYIEPPNAAWRLNWLYGVTAPSPGTSIVWKRREIFNGEPFDVTLIERDAVRAYVVVQPEGTLKQSLSMLASSPEGESILMGFAQTLVKRSVAEGCELPRSAR